MLAVNRRVSDRCAGHGRVRSRVVVIVAEEDEVRGGAEEVAVDRIPAESVNVDILYKRVAIERQNPT